FQLVDNALVAAHRAVKPLEVAVDYEDQVVQLFARGDGKCAERLHFIRLAVADEGPHLTRGLLDEAAVFQIAHEACLVNRVERPNAHGNGWETPEIRHEPW